MFCRTNHIRIGFFFHINCEKENPTEKPIGSFFGGILFSILNNHIDGEKILSYVTLYAILAGQNAV